MNAVPVVCMRDTGIRDLEVFRQVDPFTLLVRVQDNTLELADNSHLYKYTYVHLLCKSLIGVSLVVYGPRAGQSSGNERKLLKINERKEPLIFNS